MRVVNGVIFHSLGAAPLSNFGLVWHCWAPNSWSMAPHTTQSFGFLLYLVSAIRPGNIHIYMYILLVDLVISLSLSRNQHTYSNQYTTKIIIGVLGK